MPNWEVYYYTTRDGLCEIKDFLDRLSESNRQKALSWLTMLEEKGPTLPRPYADLLEDGIHELRIKLTGNQVRILYFFVFQNCIILTHSFTKRSSEVPKSEIKRAKQFRNNFNERFKTIHEFRKSML